MRTDTRTAARRLPYLLTGLALVLALAGCTHPAAPPKASSGTSSGPEDPLDVAREAIAHSPDLATCRSILQQINNQAGGQAEDTASSPSPEAERLLKERFGLEGAELSEVTGKSFSQLDAQHLEECLLFRDVARALELESGPPAERAAAAFAWVTRQVRLQERDAEPAPPYFVVRRGWGTSVERSLVFLALLRQLDLDGGLVVSKANDAPLYWACGARVRQGTGDTVLVFDPRLGLPVPGAKGEGIATLADVRTHPEILEQLSSGEARYDVTADLARRAELAVAEPMSALAPRMLYLQSRLSTKAAPVRLAADPLVELPALEKSAGAPVQVEGWATTVLYRFLPPQEGGSDKSQRRDRSMLELIPWQDLPRAILQVPGTPGQQLQSYFGRPFIDFAMATQMPRDDALRGHFIYLGTPNDPNQSRMPFELALDSSGDTDGKEGEGGQRRLTVAEKSAVDPRAAASAQEGFDRARMPRDLILHGHYAEASRLLVAMLDLLRQERERLARLPDAGAKVAAWTQKLVEAQAGLIRAQQAGVLAQDAARAQLNAVWGEGFRALSILVEGTAAEPLNGEVQYQLALCMHEQAERAQGRIERARRAGRTPSATEKRAAEGAWTDAARWWETYLEENASRPGAPAARWWRARAAEAQGNPAQAADLLRNLSGNLTPQEKTARLYRAARLQPK